MKKLLSILLTLTLFLNIFPTNAFAKGNEYLVVVRDQAPIRSDCNEDARIVARASKGDILISTGVTINMWLNRWYILDYNGEKCFIYSENVSEHTHDYVRYTYDGIKYAACPECGDATFTVMGSSQLSNDKAAVVAQYASVALGVTAIDGPLPVADVFGIFVTSIACLYTITTPSTSMVVELTRDLRNFVQSDDSRTCDGKSFYPVRRVNGDLVITSSRCMTVPEAYAFVIAGQDVYVYSEKAARACASINGSYFTDQDYGKAGYFKHFHLGADNDHRVSEAGHIFFGKSNLYNSFPHNYPH